MVARVAVQLLARSDRRAGCMTRGRGPPCWVRWKSEGRAHLARLHAACMAARPFTHLSGRKRRNARNRRAVSCLSCGGLPPSCFRSARTTCGAQPPCRRGRTLEHVDGDFARDAKGCK